MRPSPPELVTLDATALLRDVRERLGDRIPTGADGEPDPNDPAWLLLEQAAWMVSLLSEQFNDYPFRVLQQFVHLTGAELRPARPAVGVVVVRPDHEGVLRRPDGAPSPWRFFAPQTEKRDIVEFVLLDDDVPVRPGRIAGLAELRGGRLRRLDGEPDADAPELVARRGPSLRSRAFDGERIEYLLTASNAQAVLEQVRAALQELGTSGPGWLALDARLQGDSEVLLTARVAPERAFAGSAPTGLTRGGDLEGRWGALQESTWTPPVEVADHPVVPASMRGRSPLPGPTEGTILVPDLPPQLETSQLLRRHATPIPDEVAEAVWRNLTWVDTRLAGLRPRIRRELEPVRDAGEPAWAAAAVQAGLWDELSPHAPATVAHLALDRGARGAGRVRVALVDDARKEDPPVRAFALTGGRLRSDPLPVKEVWSLPLPSAHEERGMDRVRALDLHLDGETEGVLLVCEGEPDRVLLNPVLVVNAPVVEDGRLVPVERAVPEASTLRYEDIVGPAVVEQAARDHLPPAVAERLRALPLAAFSVGGETPILDFAGVGLDASAGELRLNAPDRQGRARRLRVGAEVTLDWYRRTDGAVGEVEPGAVSFVEQPPSTRPGLGAVHNPLPTFYGADRETEQACRDRVFGPAADTPMLAPDWERSLRIALGDRGRDWIIRCWTYAERSLLSTHLWPPSGPDGDPDTEVLRARLREAGPDHLLVVVGRPDGRLGDDELDWARHVTDSLVRRVRARLPTPEGAVVSRLWPLSLRGSGGGDRPLPAFDVGGFEGELEDTAGRRAEVPRRGLLLNAAVTRVLPGAKR